MLKVPAIIVCGHTDCGVIRGALNPEALREYPAVTEWLKYARVTHRQADPGEAFLLDLTERNVVAQLDNLRTHPSVAKRLAAGNLALHGWVYHIATGTVTAYDEQLATFAGLTAT